MERSRRIVCAAIRFPSGEIILGIRHGDKLMRDQYKALGFANSHGAEQGFIINHYEDNFVSRTEAYKIAKAAGQIITKTGNQNSDELFSEDIY